MLVQDLNSKPFRYLTKVAHIEGHQNISLPVYGGLQDHFVARIAKLWSPEKMRFDRFNHGDNRIHEDRDFRGANASL
jgi:hypothetical protein